MLRNLTTGLLLLTGLLVNGPDWAATATGTPPSGSTNYSGLLILLAIAYMSRRQVIGGWLLLYFIQLYLICAAFAVAFVLSFGKLVPSVWDTSAHYLWFVLSTAPMELTGIAVAVTATLLLRKRTESRLESLRRAQVANVIAGAFSVWVDYYQLHRSGDVAPLGLMIVVWPGIWGAYLYRSTRVEGVFIHRNWVYDGPVQPERTPQEKRYRRRRALLSAGAIYVTGMVVFGLLVDGDKRPDPVVLFYVPAFYAAVAFGIAWLMPIRRKKLEELNGV